MAGGGGLDGEKKNLGPVHLYTGANMPRRGWTVGFQWLCGYYKGNCHFTDEDVNATPNISEAKAGASASYTISLLPPRLHKMMDYLSTHPTCPRSTSHLGPRPLTRERSCGKGKSLLRRKCPKAGVKTRAWKSPTVPRCQTGARQQAAAPCRPHDVPRRPLHAGLPRLGKDLRESSTGSGAAPFPGRSGGHAGGRAGAERRRRGRGARQN